MFDFLKEFIIPVTKEIFVDGSKDIRDSAKAVTKEVVDSAKGFFDI